MTSEQIKQKAERYAETYVSKTAAYIAGAHSRDEEIKELKAKYIQGAKDEIKMHCEEVKRLSSVISKLKSENNKLRNPWISVEDRLPEEGQAVIVRLAFGAGNHATCNYSNGQFVWALGIETSNINIQSRLELPAITHWMPIPKV